MDSYKGMKKSTRSEKGEFSRLIEINESILNKKFETKASDDELKNLATRFDVYKIENLVLTYIITEKHNISGAYDLIASIKSKVVKFLIDGKEESVDIEETFDVILLTEDMARNNYEELQNYDIEIFDEEKIVDVGEIAAQYLSLCIFM